MFFWILCIISFCCCLWLNVSCEKFKVFPVFSIASTGNWIRIFLNFSHTFLTGFKPHDTVGPFQLATIPGYLAVAVLAAILAAGKHTQSLYILKELAHTALLAAPYYMGHLYLKNHFSDTWSFCCSSEFRLKNFPSTTLSANGNEEEARLIFLLTF